jgi:hypothetical protein
MKTDATTRRLGTTFVVVSALTIFLVALLAARGSRLTPQYRPGPVDFDDSTGLPSTFPTSHTP